MPGRAIRCPSEDEGDGGDGVAIAPGVRGVPNPENHVSPPAWYTEGLGRFRSNPAYGTTRGGNPNDADTTTDARKGRRPERPPAAAACCRAAPPGRPACLGAAGDRRWAPVHLSAVRATPLAHALVAGTHLARRHAGASIPHRCPGCSSSAPARDPGVRRPDGGAERPPCRAAQDRSRPDHDGEDEGMAVTTTGPRRRRRTT